MADFGYKTKGAGTHSNADRIIGSKFTCPENGTAESITAYILAGAGTPVKFGIYKDSDNSRVGYTEEWITTALYNDWKTLNIVSGGTLVQNTDYFLVWWRDTTGSATFYYDTGVTRGYQNIAYNGFPNPWEPTKTDNSWKFSIYCTYTPSGGQAHFQTITDLAGLADSIAKIQAGYKPVSDKTGLLDSILTVLTPGAVEPEEPFHFGRKQRIYEYLQHLEREEEEELLYSLLTVLEV